MKTKQAFILALVAVLGMCSSAFASPMLTVNTVSGEVTFWGSAGAASAVWSGSVSNPGGESDSALTGLQVVDSGLTGSSDAVALYTADVITGAFPSVQASVFTVDSSYYAELLSPASLDDSVNYAAGDSTVLDVTSSSSSGVSAEISTFGGASTTAIDVAYVPEPSTLLLICLGLVGLVARRTR
jgi:hypothetical protein